MTVARTGTWFAALGLACCGVCQQRCCSSAFISRLGVFGCGFLRSLLQTVPASRMRGRCGRLHCYITGPVFLLAAFYVALTGFHVVPLQPEPFLLVVVIGVAARLASENETAAATRSPHTTGSHRGVMSLVLQQRVWLLGISHDGDPKRCIETSEGWRASFRVQRHTANCAALTLSSFATSRFAVEWRRAQSRR